MALFVIRPGREGQINAVDARLLDILKKAADEAPATISKVEAFSGKASRSTGTKNHPSGWAVDVTLYDANGKEINNYVGNPFGAKAKNNAAAYQLYETYAQTVRAVQQRDYPDLAERMRWGGYFVGGKNPGDLMHFDISGGMMKGTPPQGDRWVSGIGNGLTVGQAALTAPIGPAVASATAPQGAKVYTLSATDRDAVTRTIIGEAIGEGDDGMAAVAHVIKNRVAAGMAPTAAAAATDPDQFDAWNHGLVTAYGPGSAIYERAAKVTDAVFATTDPADDPTKGAVYFYSGDKKPGFWKNGIKQVATIGRHIFGAPAAVAKAVVDAVTPKERDPNAAYLARQKKPAFDPAVAALQSRLAAKGLYAGKIDGTFGAGTETAVREHQKANGLVNDGVAGPDTLASLDLPTDKVALAARGTINPETPANRARLFPETDGASQLIADVTGVPTPRERPFHFGGAPVVPVERSVLEPIPRERPVRGAPVLPVERGPDLADLTPPSPPIPRQRPDRPTGAAAVRDWPAVTIVPVDRARAVADDAARQIIDDAAITPTDLTPETRPGGTPTAGYPDMPPLPRARPSQPRQVFNMVRQEGGAYGLPAAYPFVSSDREWDPIIAGQAGMKRRYAEQQAAFNNPPPGGRVIPRSQFEEAAQQAPWSADTFMPPPFSDRAVLAPPAQRNADITTANSPFAAGIDEIVWPAANRFDESTFGPTPPGRDAYMPAPFSDRALLAPRAPARVAATGAVKTASQGRSLGDVAADAARSTLPAENLLTDLGIYDSGTRSSSPARVATAVTAPPAKTTNTMAASPEASRAVRSRTAGYAYNGPGRSSVPWPIADIAPDASAYWPGMEATDLVPGTGYLTAETSNYLAQASPLAMARPAEAGMLVGPDAISGQSAEQQSVTDRRFIENGVPPPQPAESQDYATSVIAASAIAADEANRANAAAQARAQAASRMAAQRASTQNSMLSRAGGPRSGRDPVSGRPWTVGVGPSGQRAISGGSWTAYANSDGTYSYSYP